MTECLGHIIKNWDFSSSFALVSSRYRFQIAAKLFGSNSVLALGKFPCYPNRSTGALCLNRSDLDEDFNQCRREAMAYYKS